MKDQVVKKTGKEETIAICWAGKGTTVKYYAHISSKFCFYSVFPPSTVILFRTADKNSISSRRYRPGDVENIIIYIHQISLQKKVDDISPTNFFFLQPSRHFIAFDLLSWSNPPDAAVV